MISIILVEPENPDNIGAVARAMKNMGLSDLRLVKPPRGWKSKGKKLAMSAVDLLSRAVVYKTVPAALGDCHWTVGTTRRVGPRRGSFLTFRETIEQISKKSETSQRVGILFGKESKGLDNESLALCDISLSIPSSDDYPSLNLSQAVMVIAFSLFEAGGLGHKPYSRQGLVFYNQEQIAETMEHWKLGLEALGYNEGKGLLARVLTTMRGIFKRGGMLEEEAQMLKGLSRTIRNRIKR